MDPSQIFHNKQPGIFLIYLGWVSGKQIFFSAWVSQNWVELSQIKMKIFLDYEYPNAIWFCTFR